MTESKLIKPMALNKIKRTNSNSGDQRFFWWSFVKRSFKRITQQPLLSAIVHKLF